MTKDFVLIVVYNYDENDNEDEIKQVVDSFQNIENAFACIKSKFGDNVSSVHTMTRKQFEEL